MRQRCILSPYLFNLNIKKARLEEGEHGFKMQGTISNLHYGDYIILIAKKGSGSSCNKCQRAQWKNGIKIKEN